MKDMFRSLASEVSDTPFVIPLTILFIMLFGVGLSLSVESYSTTYEAYKMIPTNKVHEWVYPMVALLPSVGFITFLYIYLRDTRHRWAIWGVGVFFLVDIATDVMFKASGRGFWSYAWAFFESLFLFTLGAHCLTTIASGMILELMPPFVKQTGVFLHRISNATADTTDAFAGSAVNDKRRPDFYGPLREDRPMPFVPPTSPQGGTQPRGKQR